MSYIGPMSSTMLWKGSTANAATSTALAAETSRAMAAEATLAAQNSAALGPVRASTAAAQADGTLANGAYYYIPSASSTGALDLYLKVSNVASTFVKTIANDAAVAANSAALSVLNETTSALAFTATPPAGTDPYVETFTTISSPDTRWTRSIVSGALQIAQIQAAVLARGIQHLSTQLTPNMVVEASFSASLLTVQSGFYLSFNTNTTFDSSHGRLLGVRQNGAVQHLFGDAATTAASITSTPVLPWAVADIITLRFVSGDDATAGTLYVIINGETLGSWAIVGLPAGAYVGAMIRQNGPATGATAKILSFQTHPVATDQTRWRSINIAGTGTDKGTETNPFLTLQSAVRDFSDHPGRSAKMTLKGGIYRFPFNVSLKKYRELTVRGEKGSDVLIHGSTLVTSGWTLDSGEIYYRTLVADGISGINTTGVGAIIDLGTAHDLSAADVANGQSGTWRAGQTIPYTIYTRLSPVNGTTITLAAQKAAIQRGQSFIDPTTGRIYGRFLGGADPNTLNIEYCNRTAAFNMAWALTTDWNDCRLNLVGLHFKFPYNHVIWAQRAQVLIEECIAEGSAVGNALNLDGCGGQVNGCELRYCYNDGLHSDAVDNASIVNKPKLHINNLYAHHFLLGDCVSNHELTEHHIIGGRLEYAGKSGCAQIDTTSIVGTRFKGCAQYGVNSGSQAVLQQIRIDVTNCHFEGCANGIVPGGNIGGTSGTTAVVAGGSMAGCGGSALNIGASDNGFTTLQVDGMLDLGGNGTVGTTGITIRGRPGDMGIPRTATAASIAAVANIVNTRAKVAGRMIRETDGSKRLLTADGPLAVDPWRTADGATAVTPA